MKKIIIVLMILVILMLFVFCGCDHASTIKHNIQKDADYFGVYRRMTFINLRTSEIIYTAEGYFSLSDTSNNEIALTFKVSNDNYKINYFYVAENVTYVIEQIENTNTNPYFWEVKIYAPTPDFEVA